MSLFEKPKTLQELCNEFKQEAIAFVKENKEAVIKIEKLESFFNFNSEKLESNWLPKQIRDQLRGIGISLIKIRGKNMVKVEIND